MGYQVGRICYISTHSRAKAAGPKQEKFCYGYMISTHSRAKAAGRHFLRLLLQIGISTHSRAKAAGCPSPPLRRDSGHFNSQPREGGWI